MAPDPGRQSRATRNRDQGVQAPDFEGPLARGASPQFRVVAGRSRKPQASQSRVHGNAIRSPKAAIAPTCRAPERNSFPAADSTIPSELTSIPANDNPIPPNGIPLSRNGNRIPANGSNFTRSPGAAPPDLTLYPSPNIQTIAGHILLNF